MDIAGYTDLITAARMQREAQRLLFVFTKAELPDEHGAEQKQQFLSGRGGALAPVLCVDKLPEEAADFPALVAESELTGVTWDIVFVSAMSGAGSIPPTSDEAKQPLLLMVDSVKTGRIGNMIAFDRTGDPIQFF